MAEVPAQPIRVTPLSVGWMIPVAHLVAAIGFIVGAVRADDGWNDRIFMASLAMAIGARVLKRVLARDLVVTPEPGIDIARDGLRLRGPFRIARGLVPSPSGDAHETTVPTLAWLRIHGADGHGIELRASVGVGAPRRADWPLASIETPGPDTRVYTAMGVALEPIDDALRG